MKDEITLTRKELASAASKAATEVTEQIMKKTNKSEVSLVSNLFGVMFTAQLIKDLFNGSDEDSK